jgi:hypothetical protein
MIKSNVEIPNANNTLVLFTALIIPCKRNNKGNNKINDKIKLPLNSITLKLSILENEIIVIIVINDEGNIIVSTFLFFIKTPPFLLTTYTYKTLEVNTYI